LALLGQNLSWCDPSFCYHDIEDICSKLLWMIDAFSIHWPDFGMLLMMFYATT